MIASHKHKFAFFRITKTGSTTAMSTLRICCEFGPTDVLTTMRQVSFPARNCPDTDPAKPLWYMHTHATPAEAIEHGFISPVELAEYNCYAFLRNPYERYESAFIHNNGMPVWADDFKRVTKEHGVQDFGVLTVPQKKYFFHQGVQIVKPLDFSNYETALRGIITELGGFQPAEFLAINVRRFNHRGRLQEPLLDDENRANLKPGLQEDLDFYESVFPGRL